MERKRSTLEMAVIARTTSTSGNLRPARSDRKLTCSNASKRPVLILPLSAAYTATRQVPYRSKDATRRRAVTRAKA